jgi:hypothetical protein
MSTILADRELESKLGGLEEPVEVKTPEGKLLGHFVPDDEYRKFVYARAMECCPFSEEELRRFHEETGGTSLEELWRELGVIK